MRGTKLWQQAGSPIIQGRSRTTKPFWGDVVRALVLCAALTAAYAVAVPSSVEPFWLDRLVALVAPLMLFGVLPSIAVVWLSRSLRAGTPWLVGGVVSALVTIIAVVAVRGL